MMKASTQVRYIKGVIGCGSTVQSWVRLRVIYQLFPGKDTFYYFYFTRIVKVLRFQEGDEAIGVVLRFEKMD